MDANVEKTKKLLENGYKIVRIELKFQKQAGQDVLENIVTLKKDVNTKIIHSVNSPEYFDFVSHFKQVKDRYDSIEFIYVEDLGNYNRMMENQANRQVLQDHHKLKISGWEFSQGILTLNFKPSGPGNRIGLADFWIDLNKNPNFKEVDFKDEIEVYDRDNKLVFKGYVKNYENSVNTGFLSIQDLSLKMEHEKIAVEFIGMSPTDCVGLLTESVGFGFVPHGVPYKTNERNFIIIMPVQNLIIDQNFKIGNVEFYQKFDSLDDSLIRKSNNGRQNPLWNGNLPRARIEVEAKQFFEAITKGYTAISKAIDVAALRTDMSFPSVTINDTQKNFGFSYYRHLSRVKVPTWVYCREKDSQAHTFFNVESIIENILSLAIDPENYFTEINELYSDLIVKDNLTEDENNILQVLHWLRKSIQEGNNIDKFLSWWVAFEFLISGTKTKKLFTPSEISSLVKEVDATEFPDEKKEAIKSKLRMLNDSPLMEKFNHLRNALEVNFTDWELGILKTAREKRTDLIHGKKDVVIKDDELNKMRTILEKMLIKKVGKLKSG
jgi:hypothetical protein